MRLLMLIGCRIADESRVKSQKFGVTIVNSAGGADVTWSFEVILVLKLSVALFNVTCNLLYFAFTIPPIRSTDFGRPAGGFIDLLSTQVNFNRGAIAHKKPVPMCTGTLRSET